MTSNLSVIVGASSPRSRAFSSPVGAATTTFGILADLDLAVDDAHLELAAVVRQLRRVRALDTEVDPGVHRREVLVHHRGVRARHLRPCRAQVLQRAERVHAGQRRQEREKQN
jgi:hypothetical protein